MQKIQTILGILLFMAGLFLGCRKDEGLSPEQIRYGKADTISLGFAFRNAELEEVKAPVNVNEALVNNVNVYVFNEQGDVISHRYAVGGSSISGMVIYRNMHYQVYAVANAGESLPCRTVAEVEALSRSITNISQVSDASGGVLMCGKTSQMLLTDGQQVPMDLERCVSKFLLKCDYSQLNPGVTVTVKRVQLKNAPAKIRLFENSKATGGAVIDGEERTGSDLAPLSGAGAAFYLYENLQGVVAPAALDNKSKEQQMSSVAKANSSYIEMEYDYLSPEKTGTIVYRFYQGKTFADCDVKRNAQYLCTVLFKGNGSAGENNWSVDNSRLVDRVTGIALSPSAYTFKAPGETLQILATVLPTTANNQTLSWSSSNPAIARVDATGLVTAVSGGDCTITATSSDGTNISATCAVSVVNATLTASDLVIYTNFNANLTYSIDPPTSYGSGVKCELVDALDAAYVTIVRGESSSSSTPFILQGKTATAKQIRLKLSLVDIPTVSTTIKCTVKSGFEVTDTDFLAGNISILANHVPRFNTSFPEDDKIFVSYPVAHSKAPQAVINWRCNKGDLKVKDGNTVYTESRTTANGPGYYITLSVTGDNGVVMEYTNSRALTIYESITTHIEGHGTYMYDEEVNGVIRPLFKVDCEVKLCPALAGAPIKKEVDEANLKFRGYKLESFSCYQHGRQFQDGYDIILYTPVTDPDNNLVKTHIFNGIYQYYNSDGNEYPDEWKD